MTWNWFTWPLKMKRRRSIEQSLHWSSYKPLYHSHLPAHRPRCIDRFIHSFNQTYAAAATTLLTSLWLLWHLTAADAFVLGPPIDETTNESPFSRVTFILNLAYLFAIFYFIKHILFGVFFCYCCCLAVQGLLLVLGAGKTVDSSERKQFYFELLLI